MLSLGGDGEAAGAGGTRWTAWGRAAASRFDGEADGLILDGDVTTLTLGADAAWSRWLGGVAVAYSTGDGGFRDHERTDHGSLGSGSLSSTLTSVHPYARLSLSERLSVWVLSTAWSCIRSTGLKLEDFGVVGRRSRPAFGGVQLAKRRLVGDQVGIDHGPTCPVEVRALRFRHLCRPGMVIGRDSQT